MTETLRPFSTARMSITRDWAGNRLPEDHPWVCDGVLGFTESPNPIAEKLASDRPCSIDPRITAKFAAFIEQLVKGATGGVPVEIIGCSVPLGAYGREVAWLRASDEIIAADCGRLAVLRAVTRFDALAFIRNKHGALILTLRKGALVGFLVALQNIEVPEEVGAV